MRVVAAAALLTVAVGWGGFAPASAAPNPSGTGLPSQSCQDITAAGGSEPGHASSARGSAFNEPSASNPGGGVAGQHYNETSQYDVACYQVSQH